MYSRVLRHRAASGLSRWAEASWAWLRRCATAGELPEHDSSVPQALLGPDAKDGVPGGLVIVCGGQQAGKSAHLMAWAHRAVAAGLPLCWLDCDRSLSPWQLPRPSAWAQPGCPVAALSWATELMSLLPSAVVVIDSLGPLNFCRASGFDHRLCRHGPFSPTAADHTSWAIAGAVCRAKAACTGGRGAIWIAQQGPRPAGAQAACWAQIVELGPCS